jgi:uncharacterized protein (DUF362 family)
MKDNIVINYTSDILNGTLELLKASDLSKRVKPDMQVVLKPNMVLAKPPSDGATTHSEIVEAIIIYLQEIGVKNISIIESAWIGDNTERVYKVCGYDKLSEKYNVPLFDLKKDKTQIVNCGEFRFDICQKALNTDFLINIPVLKAHCQTTMTCCLKNLKGCIPDGEKRRFHTLGLHKPIAYLNKAIKTHFCVIDGICGDLTFEEGGNPVTNNMLIAGADPLLLDSYCAGLLGFKPSEIEYLNIAEKIEVGKIFDENTEIIELNSDKKPVFNGSTGIAKNLSKYIDEDSACSACYSALIRGMYLSRVQKNIGIGQGFKGKNGKIGCGNCTNKFEKFISGCPPKAVDVAEFLMANK